MFYWLIKNTAAANEIYIQFVFALYNEFYYYYAFVYRLPSITNSTRNHSVIGIDYLNFVQIRQPFTLYE